MKRFRSKATVQGVVASDGVDWEPPSGQASRARMVARFSRLVWKLAAKMDRWGLARRWGEFDDLFQEGMVGLLNAMDLYDESTGVKFCTYAYIAIWRRISAVTPPPSRTRAATCSTRGATSPSRRTSG